MMEFKWVTIRFYIKVREEPSSFCYLRAPVRYFKALSYAKRWEVCKGSGTDNHQAPGKPSWLVFNLLSDEKEKNKQTNKQTQCHEAQIMSETRAIFLISTFFQQTELTRT